MKKSVIISIEGDKFSALEMYLGQKNMKLTDELGKCADSLYQKYVPQNVRDFIEMTSLKKPKKVKSNQSVESENHSEQ